MHFPTFSVASTNIFPLVNSTKGGQLVTEYNLRSREMVGTDPSVQYEIGPSYVHSPNDYIVTQSSNSEASEYDSTQTYSIGEYVTYNSVTYACIIAVTTPEPFDATKWVIITSSSSILQIAPGRAVINGHYVQSLVPMNIDLAVENARLVQQSQSPLLGSLSVGIKAYYSTESTISGSMLVEDGNNVYLGVQIIILPKEEFKTPSDCPDNRELVTADIKLADFLYINGVITDIKQNPNKVSYIHSTRISNVEELLNDHFVSKDNLNAHKLYTFSGQGGDNDKATWCDSTGSLMIWDADPENKITTINPNILIPEATFLSTSDGTVHLAIPHQQIASMKNSANADVFFGIRDITLPKANYVSGAPGTVDATYTQAIKNIGNKLAGLEKFDDKSGYALPTASGNMILYLDTKSDDYILPPIPNNYNCGDYIFVREDSSARMSEDLGAAPSTMYKVIPGTVNNIQYVEGLPTGILLSGEPRTIWTADESAIWWKDDEGVIHENTEALKHLNDPYDESQSYAVDDYATYMGYVYKCIEATTGTWNSTCWSKVIEDADYQFGYTSYRGIKDEDYFQLDLRNTEDETLVQSYYYRVSNVGAKSWSNYILVTGGVPLATTGQAGGFYNVDPSQSGAVDGGYVTLDSSGRLKLIDYDLLRQGTLAYQLDGDFKLPTNISTEQVQSNLNEYVNNRIAFPSTSTISGSTTVIHVYITLPEEEEVVKEITICKIDSRFNTAVELHFLGKANSNTIINIVDCQKIKINSNISGNPIINVVRSCIYYDASVFNYIRTCDTVGARNSAILTGFKDITIWYDRLDDDSTPNLQIDGMEVIQADAPMTLESIMFWNEENPNDNEFSCALRSITFGGNGDIVGCTLYLSNNSTATNVTEGRSIIGGPFVLPQGSELVYPNTCIVKPLKVTGSFTTAYKVQNNDWIVMATNFTAKTGVYGNDTTSQGTIAFDNITNLLGSENMTMAVDSIDGWEPGTYHIFYGGTTP